MNQKINLHNLTNPYPLPPRNGKQLNTSKNTTFQHLLKNELQDIKISNHAKKRIDERNINLSKEQWTMLHTKLNEAAQKGIKDSLVIVEDSALIVNAKSKTVITALSKDEASSQIFTNINGAIVI